MLNNCGGGGRTRDNSIVDRSDPLPKGYVGCRGPANNIYACGSCPALPWISKDSRKMETVPGKYKNIPAD